MGSRTSDSEGSAGCLAHLPVLFLAPCRALTPVPARRSIRLVGARIGGLVHGQTLSTRGMNTIHLKIKTLLARRTRAGSWAVMSSDTNQLPCSPEDLGLEERPGGRRLHSGQSPDLVSH